MSALHPITAGVAVCSLADTLPFPPVAGQVGFVPTTWRGPRGFVTEFDLEVWAPGTVSLTAAELFAGVQHPKTIADDDFTGEADDDLLTATAHGLVTGDGPIRLTNAGGALPAPLATATDYWVIKIDANTFKLATSLENALAGTAINLTTDGTGTHTLSDTEDTARVHWHSHGLLGNAGDGAIALTLDKGYTALRKKHRPGAIAYALIATGPTDVSARAVPVQEV